MNTIQINEFEEYCREQLGLSIHSLRAYRQDLQSFIRFASRSSNEDITTSADIISYQVDLRVEQGLSPATIRRRMVTLRSYFRWYSETDPDFTSPFEGLRMELRVPKRLPRPVDRQTLGTVFRSVEHLVQSTPLLAAPRPQSVSSAQLTGLMLRLLVVTGLRIGELTSLRVGDVTAAATEILVHGKGNRERRVYVSNDRLRMDFRYLWDLRRNVGGPAAWLFVNARGNRLTPQSYRKRLRTLSRRLDLDERLTPHRFRHSAATLLVEEGVDIRVVQRLLGHASIATTEIYTKVSDNSLSAALAAADTLSKVDAP